MEIAPQAEGGVVSVTLEAASMVIEHLNDLKTLENR